MENITVAEPLPEPKVPFQCAPGTYATGIDREGQITGCMASIEAHPSMVTYQPPSWDLLWFLYVALIAFLVGYQIGKRLGGKSDE